MAELFWGKFMKISNQRPTSQGRRPFTEKDLSKGYVPMSFEEFPPGYKKRSIGFTTYIWLFKVNNRSTRKRRKIC